MPRPSTVAPRPGGLRIAVLAHSFPRFPGDTHGTFVKSLSSALARRGHRVTALVPFDPELAPDPDDAVAVESFRYVRPDRLHLLGYSRTLRRDVAMRSWAWLQSPLYFLFAERALGRLVRRREIDVVHAHWHLPNGWVARRVARRLGVPFAVTLHGSDVYMAERNGLFRAMARRTLADAAHLTSCSADLRDRLLTIGGHRPADAAKLHLVPNGTDPPTAAAPPAVAAALRRRLGVDDAGPLVVAVGRMVDKKGFRYLVEAWPRLVAIAPTARLVLAGGGDLLPAMRQEASRRGVAGSIVFPGALAHDEVLALLALADVFVMPSVRDARGNIDGLPIVVLEAMAAGLPVVATDLAGMPLAVVDGVTGRLVPPADPAALAAAIGELLADRDLARRQGEAGRARVRDELNWDAVAARHDELLHAAVRGSRCAS